MQINRPFKVVTQNATAHSEVFCLPGSFNAHETTASHVIPGSLYVVAAIAGPISIYVILALNVRFGRHFICLVVESGSIGTGLSGKPSGMPGNLFLNLARSLRHK